MTVARVRLVGRKQKESDSENERRDEANGTEEKRESDSADMRRAIKQSKAKRRNERELTAGSNYASRR